MPTVTIIIPTYNRVGLLRQAVDALINQSHPPDEIIVVDDGSTDGTAEFLAMAPVSLTVIRQVNQGRSAARNAGLAASHGEWVILHDDDDLLPSDSLQLRLANAASNPDVDVWYGDTVDVDEDGTIMGPTPGSGLQSEGDIFPLVAEENRTPIHSVMFRRRCLEYSGAFETSMHLQFCEDWDFWIRMSAVSRYGYIPAVVAHYRRDRNPKQVNIFDIMAYDAWAVQTRVFDMDRFGTLPPLERAQIYRRYSIRCLRIGRADLAADSLQEAIKLVPDPGTRLLRGMYRLFAMASPQLQLKLVHSAIRLRSSLRR